MVETGDISHQLIYCHLKSLDQDIFLVTEIVVDDTGGESGRFGNVVGRDVMVALLKDQVAADT